MKGGKIEEKGDISEMQEIGLQEVEGLCIVKNNYFVLYLEVFIYLGVCR